ncbi:MAG: Flp family type IVb pilin [Actinomycetota bacterium]
MTGLMTAWAVVRTVTRKRASEAGNAFVEYAVLVALVAVVCIAAVTFFGEKTDDSFSSSGSALESVAKG